ncbi:MAG: hypothetical protein ACYCYP_13280 [Leptospirales bacterium]
MSRKYFNRGFYKKSFWDGSAPRASRPSRFVLYLGALLWICGATSQLPAAVRPLQEPGFAITVLNPPDPQKPIRRNRILLHMRVRPTPSPTSPAHFHIYVDGRMETMFVMTGPETDVTLNHLPPGKHCVWIIQADPRTHRLLQTKGKMSGGSSDMEMGPMSDGGTGSAMRMHMDDHDLPSIPKSIRVTKIVLLVQ